MCSNITHPVVPIVLSMCFPRAAISPGLIVAGAICSMIPDLDVIGFQFGIRYNDMLGHRGLTHSILFAAAFATLLTFTLFRNCERYLWLIFLFLFLSILSHPLLDMLTNGGLGIALLAPFSNARFFFPFRPIEVSPIGVGSFFSDWGVRVLLSEMKWVWLPSTVVFAIGYLMRRYS